MDVKRIKNYNYLFLGLVAGFSSAALGIGGGVIMVPVLLLLFHYEIKKAIGTSLVTIVPTSFIGIITHYSIESSNIKFLTALFVIMGSIIGARFGSILANKIRGTILRRLFALLLLFVGLKLTNIINIPTETISNIAVYPLLIILGLVAGSGSALFGIGGGVIMVPVLNLFFGLSMHEAIATSLTVILPTTFAGTMFHRKFDNINNKAIKFLIPTALVGAVFGAIFANSLPSGNLKIIFGVFMIMCSIRIFLQSRT